MLITVLGLGIFVFYTSKCNGEVCHAQENNNTEKSISKITPEVIKKLVESKEIILLDVREESEWNEGHIKGAIHIPLGNINNETLKETSKDYRIYVYCRSGRRASVAEFELRKLGFSKVINLGGIIEWQENGGELIK